VPTARYEQVKALLAREPNDVFLNYGLAMELVKSGRLDEAVEQFSRVLQLDPDYVAAYFQKSKALVQAGRRDEARDTLNLGIERARVRGDRHAMQEMQEFLAAM